MVFQSFELFPHRTVIENLDLAQVEVLRRTRAAATERSMRLLERVGLADQAAKYPAALVGWTAAACGDRACARDGPGRHVVR